MNTTPLLLLIETTGQRCSVSLSHGDQLVQQLDAQEEFSHAKHLASLTKELCVLQGIKASQLDGYVISGGPGSYTGLRIGFSFIKGLAMATGKPIIKVDTLDALMSEAIKSGIEADYYYAGIDARRMEAYTKVFDRHGVTYSPLEAKIYDIQALQELNSSQERICFLGTANEKLRTVLTSSNLFFEFDELSSSFLVGLAHSKWLKNEFENIFFVAPTYLKPPNITKSKKSYFL